MHPARLRLPLLAMAACLTMAAPSFASEPAPGRTPVVKPSSLYAALFLQSPGAFGLRAPVTDDPSSQPIPLTLEDALGPQVPVESLFEVQLPDGSFMMDLQGTGQHFMMLDPDPLAFPRRFLCNDIRHSHGIAPVFRTRVEAPASIPVTHAER